MAHLNQRRSENVAGDLYVDQSCIDCDTCRWMAPEVFREIADQSAVYRQPSNPTERLHALQALLSCPTASIGTTEPPSDIQAVQQTFPVSIADQVYHCGFHSKKSFGAASYFIQRPDGNILIDSPRFAAPLVKKLEGLGGIRWLYLTHQDDVADHQAFHDHFGCERILHEDDIRAETRQVERQLTGTDPIKLADDITILPVPGHTKGHTVLLYNEQFLFSGDHLAWSGRLGHLYAFRDACWYSWKALTLSMERLSTYDFAWVLPGHGRRYYTDRSTMKQQMQRCLTWMKQQP
ncbi:MAG: MBL fold metallo-hydrolase [Cyanobacteriota bacterium]|nr:MBL fold metallo-hydrolase [Cyanobacteriota bacterium]